MTDHAPLTDDELAAVERMMAAAPWHPRYVRRLIADLRTSRGEMLRLAERLVSEGHWHEDTLEEWKKEWGLL